MLSFDFKYVCIHLTAQILFKFYLNFFEFIVTMVALGRGNINVSRMLFSVKYCSRMARKLGI
jgi:hypothetical protein